MTKLLSYFRVLGVAAALVPVAALAQTVGGLDESSSRSNFGEVSLDPSTWRDPIAIDVLSGGLENVATLLLGVECVGWASRQPDYVLTLEDSVAGLHIWFTGDGDGDTVLLVNGPGGSWRCNDDSDYFDVDPSLDLVGDAGTYRIWVASYNRDETVPGELVISSETLGSGDGSGARFAPGSRGDPWDDLFFDEMLDIGPIGADVATVRLDRGNGPIDVYVVSGGSLSVWDMDIPAECVGWAAFSPDLIVELGAGINAVQLSVESEGDTALVVYGPRGRWYCNDDAIGVDPEVLVEGGGAGIYRIWLASYDPDEYLASTLFIDTMNRNH